MSEQPTFSALGLAAPLMKALDDAGYEVPSPIQAESIPLLLEGHDMIGQAQTGTGKTAAFALPLLSRMDVTQKKPQLLVLTPTRELAIQVAEAFQRYARYLENFHVLPVYGGQGYDHQLKFLKRGVQVVVGTPGRVMDHIRRKTLQLDQLNALVLDEADEMLRMGFIDDVDWILGHTPEEKQIALFSATMPSQIRKVAERHLRQPKTIKIAAKTTTAKTIRQRYWQVSGLHKLDALTRILEIEEFEAMLIFVRTKTATLELSEKLSARGYSAAALNGDIPQNMREKTVERLKSGSIDIVIATDVAARGLDVPRISHVLNYDIPYDTESYVHRIGRTGRAGRSGEAILFVAPRERRLLSAIERATNQTIEHMQMPSIDAINEQRMEKFKQQITETIESKNCDFYYQLIAEYQEKQEVEPLKIAAALALMGQGQVPLLLEEPKRGKRTPDAGRRNDRNDRNDRGERNDRGRRSERPDRGADSSERAPKKAWGERRPHDSQKPVPSTKAQALKEFPDIPMQRYKVAVGHNDEVKPGNIVGAIANEADIESCYIGHIEICDNYTTVDLPGGMPREVMEQLKKAYVCGSKLNIQPFKGESASADAPRGERTSDDSAPARKPKWADKDKDKKPKARKKVREADRKNKGKRRGNKEAQRDTKITLKKD